MWEMGFWFFTFLGEKGNKKEGVVSSGIE